MSDLLLNYIHLHSREMYVLSGLKIMRKPKAVNRRTDNVMAKSKRPKDQTMIYKTLDRKQNIE